MGKLTTHVLDTAHGCPAAGMAVTLYALADDGQPQRLKSITLNHDGRADGPLLEGDALKAGRYRLVFAVSAYFAARGTLQADPPFLGEVPLDFDLLKIHPFQIGTMMGYGPMNLLAISDHGLATVADGSARHLSRRPHQPTDNSVRRKNRDGFSLLSAQR